MFVQNCIFLIYLLFKLYSVSKLISVYYIYSVKNNFTTFYLKFYELSQLIIKLELKGKNPFAV